MPRVDRSSPVLVALTALLLYAAWVGWAHHIGHDWRDWATIGKHFVGASETSPAITRDAPHATSRFGYDGQFFLYIARDPDGAVPYLDNASYRYGRIVYPLAARGLALGRQEAIPLALIVLNLLAVAVGTWAIAAWLRRERFPEWFALLYAAFPGVFFGVWRDLSEPLAYSLTAVALLAFDGDRPRRIALSAALFSVAILTREGAAVFVLVWAAALAVQGRRLRATLFAVGSLLPYLAYRFVFLNLWLGNAGLPDQAAADPGALRRDRPLLPVGRRRAAARLRRALARMLLRRARRASRSSAGREPPPSGRCSRTRSSSSCSCRPPPTRTTRRQAGSRQASSLRSCCRCRP